MKNSEKKGKARAAEEHEHRASSDPFTNPAAEIFKTFAAGMKKPHVDREAVMNNHRKNLDAMNEANKMAVEVIKTIAQLQSQYVRQTFEDMNALMKDMAASQSSNNHWESHAGKIKEAMTKAIDHTASIANVMVKSNHDIYNKMQHRMNEATEDMHEAAKKYKN